MMEYNNATWKSLVVIWAMGSLFICNLTLGFLITLYPDFVGNKKELLYKAFCIQP